MQRKFKFFFNDEEKKNFKMCDLKFFLESYDEVEILIQKTDSPQHLLVIAKDFEDNTKDKWEVIEEKN